MYAENHYYSRVLYIHGIEQILAWELGRSIALLLAFRNIAVRRTQTCPPKSSHIDFVRYFSFNAFPFQTNEKYQKIFSNSSNTALVHWIIYKMRAVIRLNSAVYRSRPWISKECLWDIRICLTFKPKSVECNAQNYSLRNLNLLLNGFSVTHH